MTLDEEVDRLYQLPLSEFTAARNALAKQLRGADTTHVRGTAEAQCPGMGSQSALLETPAHV